jgi:hypothetical protein
MIHEFIETFREVRSVMLTVTPQSLGDSEAAAWASYSRQRTCEIRALKPHLSPSFVDGIAWFEFLQMKWGLACDTPFTGMDRLEYALKVRTYGPDIRAIPRFRAEFLAHLRPKKVCSTSCNSAYNFFVRKKFQEIRDPSGSPLRVTERIPIIANEWRNMPAADKEEVKREWKEFVARHGDE